MLSHVHIFIYKYICFHINGKKTNKESIIFIINLEMSNEIRGQPFF